MTALRKGRLMLTGRSRRGSFTKEATRVWAEQEKAFGVAGAALGVS